MKVVGKTRKNPNRLPVRTSAWSIGDSNPWPRQCECRALTKYTYIRPDSFSIHASCTVVVKLIRAQILPFRPLHGIAVDRHCAEVSRIFQIAVPASFDIRLYIEAALFSVIKGHDELVIRRGNNLRCCWAQQGKATSLMIVIGSCVYPAFIMSGYSLVAAALPSKLSGEMKKRMTML